MRFLHTGDWHLGRLFHGIHLVDDQAYLLAQMEKIAEDCRPDFYLIAGDIYDRTTPPTEAVELLNDHLSRIVLDLKIPVILIAGNHDSPQRLSFGARLFEDRGLYIRSFCDYPPTPVILRDDHGPVYIYPLPYGPPHVHRKLLNDQSIQTHQQAMEGLIGAIWDHHPKNTPSILLGHTLVQGGLVSTSERPLSIQSDQEVSPALFEPFDYVALGHLHRPQFLGRNIHYCGSLMKYSLSEIQDEKSIVFVEMDSRGKCISRIIPLIPRRDFRSKTGYLKDLLKGPESAKDREDYLSITLLDQGGVFDPVNRLREVYPHLVQLIRSQINSPSPEDYSVDPRGKTELQLFGDFWELVMERPPKSGEEEAFKVALKSAREEKK